MYRKTFEMVDLQQRATNRWSVQSTAVTKALRKAVWTAELWEIPWAVPTAELCAASTAVRLVVQWAAKTEPKKAASTVDQTAVLTAVMWVE